MKVFNVVKQLREDRNLSQKDLAEALEVSRQTIHAI
ncbi:TPA: helix-turn-helix domain-containing protein, partial [Listeria innocua]|nr:helix-turn-helix domain-containing protein [Listeria innocua]